MSNQNNDNNPPPSTQNIQVTPNTEAHTETVNTAGIALGGVGNTNINVIQAQGDKERVEKEIEVLKEEVETFQQQTYDKREDIQNIEKKIHKLMDDIELKKDEIAKLEENVIPELKKQIEEAEIRLEVLKDTVEDTSSAIPALEKQVLDLMQNLTKYGTDVKAEKENIAELYSLMQRMEDEQSRQKRQCEDLQRENKDLRRENKEFQSQIQNLHEVIEEKDNDIRQLKDARTAAAESKVQEPQDAVQETTTQDGREEGKKASSDVTRRGATATVTAGGSVACQGVTQKDSNPRHVDALLDACRYGNMAEVKRVLDLGQVDINCRGEWSYTPVMEAAVWGHREVVELLLSRGADVSLVDEDGDNTLHLACVLGDVGTVELILSQDGVDVNARSNDGQTAADKARGLGHHQLADLLVSRGAR